MTQETSSNWGQIVLELELRQKSPDVESLLKEALKEIGPFPDSANVCEPSDTPREIPLELSSIDEDLPFIPVAIEVSLEDAARFPDVVALVLELDIDEDDESDDASAALFGQIVEFIEQWLRDNQVQATGEIQTAVEFGFLVLDAQERSTESQIAKYDQFIQLLDGDEIIDGLLEIVSCTELTEEDLGETWGVTLWPEEKILARVYVGSRVLAEVWQSGRGVVFQIMVIGEVEIPGFIGDSAFMSPGFENVDGSMMVSVLSERLFNLLDIPAVEDQIASHATFGAGRLPRTNMHNPMSEIFIFSGDLQS
jgi:hypothetical protein